MAIHEEDIRQALKVVKFPGLTRDIVSFGFVKAIAVDGGKISVELQISSADPDAAAQIEREARAALESLP
ncbi:MAG: iron-sulfur cluster assembly protein, partial [Acidobacteria bacterium]|nr:iron-sulfur cluster assembly protein [Acidobacteriota bacterium]